MTLEGFQKYLDTLPQGNKFAWFEEQTCPLIGYGKLINANPSAVGSMLVEEVGLDYMASFLIQGTYGELNKAVKTITNGRVVAKALKRS